MASRGSKTKNGHITTSEYHQERLIDDAKVLKGNTPKEHGLPDYAHSPNSKYIKENADGTFREMRIYDADGNPVMEIGYHAEINITGNRHEKVLHYHTFANDDSLRRTLKGELSQNKTPELYSKYKKYLEVYGL